MLTINELIAGNTRLQNLNNINIIMGRNGSGKSRFLRSLEAKYRDDAGTYVRYVSPERAGTFRRDGNVLTNMSNNPNWLSQTRSNNQVPDFKAASATLLREAETIYLRRLAATPEIRDDYSRSFQIDRLDRINRLLTNISLEVSNTDFEFRSLADGKVIDSNNISSGESEAVSLATEILYFFDTIDPDKFNVLMLDEPDVHLHPDLQARLGKLIVSMLDEFSRNASKIAVCMSTHSAPLVCALADSQYVSIGTKNFGVDAVELKPAPEELRKVAPFFGHPLSLSLSDDAALILEGEDDERVWQQAARSSQGKLKVFPVLAVTVNQQTKLEDFCVELLGTLYENPVAFSLRDGDGVVGQALDHKPPLKRFRLACYAIENLLATEECLAMMQTSGFEFVAKVHAWLIKNEGHKDFDLMSQLVKSSDRLRHSKIKDIRNLICAVAGSTKPWEVIVGQAIGGVCSDDLSTGNMLVDYLGAELVRQVVLREP
jgi:ABC-type branched-subunit amino acid transport system ATPase component